MSDPLADSYFPVVRVRRNGGLIAASATEGMLSLEPGARAASAGVGVFAGDASVERDAAAKTIAFVFQEKNGGMAISFPAVSIGETLFPRARICAA